VASGGSTRLNTSSPFNIKVESLTLSNFSQADVAELYQQHTAETGQVFSPEAVQQAFDLTQGQPWLVNALARQMVEVIAPDPSEEITLDHVNTAKEILIHGRIPTSTVWPAFCEKTGYVPSLSLCWPGKNWATCPPMMCNF
jgi:hypothetical protein